MLREMVDETQSLESARFVAFDLETTGRDPREDRITEVGLVVFDGGEVVDRYGMLVNPERSIPAEVTEITGIRDEDVANQPTFVEIVDEVMSRLEGSVLLAYNADFDLGMLRGELERLGRRFTPEAVLDPFLWSWVHLRKKKLTKSAQLGEVCRYLGVDLDQAHRAVHDAEASGWAMLRMSEVAPVPSTLREVLAMQSALKVQVEDEFARFRRRAGERAVLNAADVTVELGAAFVYGEESDPIRYLYQRLPDVRDVE